MRIKEFVEGHLALLTFRDKSLPSFKSNNSMNTKIL